MNLLTSISPRCTRYYIDGKRVSRDAFDEAKFWRTLSCFSTQIRRGFTRHYCSAT